MAVLGRAIAAEPGEEPLAAVQRYLRAGQTETALLLAQKAAVVLLEPVELIGRVIWPAV